MLAKDRMEKHDHQQSHGRKRNYVFNRLETLPESVNFDGESCLVATTASLLNALSITQTKAKYSDAYRVGMGAEKHLNTFADLVASWNSEKARPWHNQTGDFWGPIFTNLREGGGWLMLSEIFATGFEHRFISKSPNEAEAWKRFPSMEEDFDNDPAMLLFNEISGVYRDDQPAIPIPMNRLFEFTRIRDFAMRAIDVDDAISEDIESLDRRVINQLLLERPPEVLQPVAEVDNWDLEIENAWRSFSEIF
jgi:hypothetical protein